jgi:hypothetical protein
MVAFPGSAGRESNTRLTKFSSYKNTSLESIIRNSRHNINEKLEARAKIALKYIHPGAYYGLLAAEFLYKHRDEIFKTIKDVADIWSKDTPVSDKIASTAGRVLEAGVDVAKDELKEKAVSIIASKFSEAAVETIDQYGVIETVSQEVGLSDHKERFKELLQDTIKQQASDVLKNMLGDKI